MGDVNHGNCVVLRDGTVKLIDCDSYSISKGDFRYRCEVGVATHLAPELQGVDLGEVERENKHDNFGLAVIIFQLLFLGRHPFSGNYLGDEDKSLEDCIRELRFAYGSDANLRMVKQPPGTLSLSKVSPRISTMLERAFLTEDRPEPREWIEALEDLSDNLKQCGLHIGHFYFDKLQSCPWCELESQTGLMLFPFVSGNTAAGAEHFNIFTVENLVSSLNVPQQLATKPPKSSILPPPSPEAENARRENLSRFIMLAILQFSVVVFLTVIAGSGVGFFIGAILMTGMIVMLSNTGKNSKGDLEARLEKSQQDWNQLENEWKQSDTAPQFNGNLSLIREKISEHHQLQRKSREKVKLLRDEVFHYKLGVYLSSFKIADAKIVGVGQKNLELLRSFGIRSAVDVEGKRLGSLPPIHNEIKEKVLEWRRNLERKFEYNPDAELPEVEQNRLTLDFTEKRGKIEREIENLLIGLRSGSTFLQQRQTHLSVKAEALSKQLSQNESDLAAVGSITLPIVVLILITTLIPMFGNAFSSSKSIESRTSPSNTDLRVLSNGTTVKAVPLSSGGGSNSSNRPATANVYGYNVPNTLTDKEIENLTSDEKASGAQQLLERATQLINVNKDYKTAEQRLRIAVKLAPENVEILNKLGDVLFEQKDYKESLTYLNRSLIIEPTFTETKSSIGANYLRMNYNEDARKIFADLVTQNPKSFEANFNLGLAYKGLGDNYPAVSCFRTAILLKYNDAEAHYQYAVVLNKVGTKEDVLKEYQKLLDLDPKVAEKLRKDLGLKNIRAISDPPRDLGNGLGSGNGSGR
jgi:DNA-binding helix-hairpin-helix protein with protein kinase domain/Tfp pilus assembly protein PilF